MAYPDAKFYLHTTSFDKVITKEKWGYKLLSHPVFYPNVIRSVRFSKQIDVIHQFCSEIVDAAL